MLRTVLYLTYLQKYNTVFTVNIFGSRIHLIFSNKTIQHLSLPETIFIRRFERRSVQKNSKFVVLLALVNILFSLTLTREAFVFAYILDKR